MDGDDHREGDRPGVSPVAGAGPSGEPEVTRAGSGPAVKFPPPLVFLPGFAAGLLVRRAVPVPLVPESLAPARVVLAWSVFIVSAGIVAWALATFWLARTPVYPHHDASALVRRGPYRWSRNPMYVALTGMYVGGALWVDSPWPLVFLPLVLWCLWLTVIRREERHLKAVFPEKYAEYRRSVRRWL